MKKVLIFLGVVVIIIVLLHLALFIFINQKGKDIVVSTIEKSLGLKATLDSLTVKFPFTLTIKNFQCGDIAFKEVDVTLTPVNFFTRQSINRIYIEGLSLKVKIDKKGNVQFMSFPAPEAEVVEKEVAKKEEPPKDEVDKPEAKPSVVSKPKPAPDKELKVATVPFKIKNLRIRNSQVEILDQRGRKPLRVTFKDVDLKLKDFSCPQLSRFNLDFNASLRPEKDPVEDYIKVAGWVDYLNRNLDVKIDLNSIDYFLFLNRYPPLWRPENLGIAAAQLSLAVDLNSWNNDLQMDVSLSLDQIEFVPDENGSFGKNMAKTIIALLKGDTEKASFQFVLETKMDSPHFDSFAFKKQFKKAVPLGPAVIANEAIKTTKDKLEAVAGDAKGKIEAALEGTKEVTVDQAIDTIEGVIDIFKSEFDSEEDTK